MKFRLRDWLLMRRSHDAVDDVNKELTTELKKMSDTVTFHVEDIPRLNNTTPQGPPKKCRTKPS